MTFYDDDYMMDHDFYEGEDIDGVGFADPGGESALRASTPGNPRIHRCPTCHAPNALTPIDVAHHYQCDGCANSAERGMDRGLCCGGVKNGCEICKEYEEA